MFISLCLFLFIDSCYYRIFSLVLSTVLRKVIFLDHLVSLFDILGVREKFRILFRSQLASLDILRHCILTHLIFQVCRRNFMERSMCGSSLLGTRTTGTRSRTITTYALWGSKRRPLSVQYNHLICQCSTHCRSFSLKVCNSIQ